MGKQVRSKAEEELAGLRLRRWTAQEATVVLSAWQASGLSMAAFSRRYRLTAQRVAWWRDRLSKREKPSRRREQSAGGLRFAPVVLRGPAARGDGAAVTIRVRGGMAVEIADPALVPARWLSALIREYEGPTP